MKDTVCIGTEVDLCVKDFEFFEIVSAESLQDDGILGLSPINPS